MMICEAMRKLRGATGLRQSGFGVTIGVSGSRISQIENGRGGLWDRNLLRLFDVHGPTIERLGLSMRDFLAEPEQHEAAGE